LPTIASACDAALLAVDSETIGCLGEGVVAHALNSSAAQMPQRVGLPIIVDISDQQKTSLCRGEQRSLISQQSVTRAGSVAGSLVA
jgi:hypothetical protein